MLADLENKKMIDDAEAFKKILEHLDLWEVRRKPPTRANSPPIESFIIALRG
jgi:hypothetical protein